MNETEIRIFPPSPSDRIQAVLQDALAFRAGTAWWLSDQEEEFLRVLSTAPTLFDGVFWTSASSYNPSYNISLSAISPNLIVA